MDTHSSNEEVFPKCSVMGIISLHNSKASDHFKVDDLLVIDSECHKEGPCVALLAPEGSQVRYMGASSDLNILTAFEQNFAIAPEQYIRTMYVEVAQLNSGLLCSLLT